MAINQRLLSIDGWEFPTPSTYKGYTSTIVDSARNTQGIMVGSVIRDDIAKIEVSWRFLTVEQWSYINKLFSIKHGGRFINNVTFFDQTRADLITRKMYVNDRSADMLGVDENGVRGWLSPSLHLIEV